MKSAAFASAHVGLIVAPKARSVSAKAAGRPMWLPGAEPPVWLDGSMPCDYGFDPIGLGKNPANLAKWQEYELINARWAMLGAAGCIAVELCGQGSWRDAPNWAITGGVPTYFGVAWPKEAAVSDIGLLAIAQIILVGGAELYRGQDPDREKRMYPGGAFDPMGFSKDEDKLLTMKKKELANGRLAMVAMFGFYNQSEATKKGPLANWVDHISNPMVNNCGSNGVSVPAAGFNLPDFA